MDGFDTTTVLDGFLHPCFLESWTRCGFITSHPQTPRSGCGTASCSICKSRLPSCLRIPSTHHYRNRRSSIYCRSLPVRWLRSPCCLGGERMPQSPTGRRGMCGRGNSYSPKEFLALFVVQFRASPLTFSSLAFVVNKLSACGLLARPEHWMRHFVCTSKPTETTDAVSFAHNFASSSSTSAMACFHCLAA